MAGEKAAKPAPPKHLRKERSPLPPDVALGYRVNDAAEVAGLSRGTIYNLIGEGKLRSVLVAGRRLIPADALRELLQGAREPFTLHPNLPHGTSKTPHGQSASMRSLPERKSADRSPSRAGRQQVATTTSLKRQRAHGE
jgi:excisionase family DNA binding protein